MNPLIKKIKSNIFPFLVFTTLLVGCLLALYRFHPASPYHDRYTFVVRYETIGTLSEGNRVEVRGITKGEIKKVELTEDAVYVTVNVLADTKIPVNSEFRLKTAGLMGEREMSVLTGDSKTLISNGDTLNGFFEEGANAIGTNLAEIFMNLDSIVVRLSYVKDSVLYGPQGKQIQRIINKADKLTHSSKENLEEWKGQVNGFLENIENTLEKSKKSLALVSKNGENTIQQVNEMNEKLDNLAQKVNNLKIAWEKINEKLDGDDNSTALFLAPNGQFSSEIEQIRVDVDKLIKDIKKNGLKLNVDIF